MAQAQLPARVRLPVVEPESNGSAGSRGAFVTFKAPLYVAWELTHRCNAECIHCYSNSGIDASVDSDLTTAEALALIDELAEAGILVLAFSGGEPMLRRDWRKLVEHAVRCGLSVNVGTNGAIVTDAVADDLAKLRVASVTVSIDSHRPDVHDAFRGVAGLHRRAMHAIERLRERGLRVVVGFTPTQRNWRDGPEVVALASALGASAVNLSEYVPAGRGTLDLALSANDLRAVLTEWIQLRAKYQGRLQLIWHDCRVAMLVPENERRDYMGCGAGRLVARICPDGTVTPCVFLPTAIGSVRRSSFRDIWKSSSLLAAFREREGRVSGNCGTCSHLSTCGGCRAVANAYSEGDPLAGDPHCWIEPMVQPEMQPLAFGESLPV